MATAAAVPAGQSGQDQGNRPLVDLAEVKVAPVVAEQPAVLPAPVPTAPQPPVLTPEEALRRQNDAQAAELAATDKARAVIAAAGNPAVIPVTPPLPAEQPQIAAQLLPVQGAESIKPVTDGPMAKAPTQPFVEAAAAPVVSSEAVQPVSELPKVDPANQVEAAPAESAQVAEVVDATADARNAVVDRAVSLKEISPSQANIDTVLALVQQGRMFPAKSQESKPTAAASAPSADSTPTPTAADLPAMPYSATKVEAQLATQNVEADMPPPPAPVASTKAEPAESAATEA